MTHDPHKISTKGAKIKIKVKYLFCFQRKFNEDLLEFLIDIINAELFKSVPLKDLKTVDIQNTNVDFFMGVLHSYVHRL